MSPAASVFKPTVVTLKIDEKDVSASTDQSILDVARENGIEIPTLCFLEGLTSWGACRLCLVEIQGNPRLLPACITRVAEGMHILTDTPRLRSYRKSIVELLLTERNHICAVCVSNGQCELQTLAQSLGITHVSMPYRYPKLSVDSSNDLFRLDHNRCVLCTRCVRVCDEIEGAHTWDVMGRGTDARVIVDLNEPWGDSETCTRCGKCIQACPTGALAQKGTAVSEMRKKPQFLTYLTTMREHHD